MPDKNLTAVSHREEKPAHTPEELKSMIQADRVMREQRAMASINQVLKAERCVMNPVMVLANGNVTGRIEITAKD
jgi:hypothetical protein